jgi:putative hydrolase of the HAD superfamily
MNKPQILLVDLDDTLIHCNKYFDIVLEQFTDLLQTFFASFRLQEQQIMDMQLEIDTAGVQLNGFTPEHFPQSLVDTYRHFSALTGRRRDKREEEQLLTLGKSVYDYEVEPYPYMAETLEELQGDGHRLYLYTGGVAAIQQRKVEAMQLGRFFEDRIFIRRHKTTPTLEKILQENGFDRSITWMIGNSIRTDIVPAIETGIHAVYIPAFTEWAFNIVEIPAQPKGAFLKLNSLLDLRAELSRHLAQTS